MMIEVFSGDTVRRWGETMIMFISVKVMRTKEGKYVE
jgi:hypothetical protein